MVQIKTIDELEALYKGVFERWSAAVSTNTGIKSAADALDAKVKGATPEPALSLAAAPKTPGVTG